MPIIKCEICGNEKFYSPSRIRIGKGRFCSKECGYKSKLHKHSEDVKKKMSETRKGHLTSKETKRKIGLANKGKIISDKRKKQISKSLTGRYRNEENPRWKGDNVGYGCLHAWVRKYLGQPTKCEHCGKDGLTGHQIHWANKSGEYKRNLDDWLRLCVKCHCKYDLLNN